MITPVPDVAPRVVLVGYLPIDTFVRDAIRIKSVGCRGVDELGDYVCGEMREAQAKRFPILEYVTPVSLIAQPVRTVFVLYENLEPIPRAAWVTVPTAECNRETFVTQSFEVRVRQSSRLLE